MNSSGRVSNLKRQTLTVLIRFVQIISVIAFIWFLYWAYIYEVGKWGYVKTIQEIIELSIVNLNLFFLILSLLVIVALEFVYKMKVKKSG